jgi:hypothetical protein
MNNPAGSLSRRAARLLWPAVIIKRAIKERDNTIRESGRRKRLMAESSSTITNRIYLLRGNGRNLNKAKGKSKKAKVKRTEETGKGGELRLSKT